MGAGRGKGQFKSGTGFSDIYEAQPAGSGILSSADVGRKVLAAAEDGAQSESSEWGPRGRRVREVERRQDAEELGAGGEN